MSACTVAQRPTDVVTRRERAAWSRAAALGAGSVLAVVGLAVLVSVAQRMSDPVESMEPGLLRAGYLGSVATVAGAAYLMMAVVLVSLHRVVPAGPAAALGPAAGAPQE